MIWAVRAPTTTCQAENRSFFPDRYLERWKFELICTFGSGGDTSLAFMGSLHPPPAGGTHSKLERWIYFSERQLVICLIFQDCISKQFWGDQVSHGGHSKDLQISKSPAAAVPKSTLPLMQKAETQGRRWELCCFIGLECELIFRLAFSQLTPRGAPMDKRKVHFALKS